MSKRGNGSPKQELENRAKEIIQNKNILDIGSDRYKVESQSVDNAFYEVTFGENGWKCTCPYHIYGIRKCKHIYAMYFTLYNQSKLADEISEVMITEPDVMCRFCNGTDYIKRGIRQNKNYTVQIYGCKSCNRRFIHNPGFLGRHYPPEVIANALFSYAAAMSCNKTAQQCSLNGINVTGFTVLRWSEDYGTFLKKFQEKYIRVGNVWHADEIHFKVCCVSKWLFAVMDAETRLIITYDVSKTKFGYNATSLFKKAKHIAKKYPDLLVTDALSVFKTGFKKALHTKSKPRASHIADVGIRNRHTSNNIYERFNGAIRDRIARIRGFKSDNPALLDVMIIQHNFVSPHGGLGGKTPAEAAGIMISGHNKRLTMIRHAAVFCA